MSAGVRVWNNARFPSYQLSLRISVLHTSGRLGPFRRVCQGPVNFGHNLAAPADVSYRGECRPRRRVYVWRAFSHHLRETLNGERRQGIVKRNGDQQKASRFGRSVRISTGYRATNTLDHGFRSVDERLSLPAREDCRNTWAAGEHCPRLQVHPLSP